MPGQLPSELGFQAHLHELQAAPCPLLTLVQPTDVRHQAIIPE
jgi:hypothetical protein